MSICDDGTLEETLTGAELLQPRLGARLFKISNVISTKNTGVDNGTHFIGRWQS